MAEKKSIQKGIIIGIILLFLSTTCIPVLASEGKPSSTGTGKPDLIVASMSFSPYGDSGIVAAATIENIGDTKAAGTLYLEYTFSRLIFGTITNTDTVCMFGGLDPGEEAYWPLIYESELPKFGFFEFKCTVNPGGGAIEESNYDNNDLSQKYVAFLGHWKEIG